ncbi:MAG TPA: 3-hydroxyacyl-ACP dehydratase FabZ family protein [Myxococcota bacterium]|nr:3-hydroxyacyl-ACP dehydratase FabZ family protein [Myxococcota bacterium]HRY95801.1 3-hydroxyacyl-ACP dehydratase FabZ family protein [Myxococcota bacterium]HSA23408.1 3-hydroxyacyl-ACP dehydratase FabZ family protein [Myxococcota bacterium]
MRYVLLDRIEEVKRGEYAEGLKAVALSEDCFEHHFPGQPVYPGALLIESMAQLGGALLELSLKGELGYSPRCVLSSVKAKFRDFVKPGDLLRLRAEIVSAHEDSALVKVLTRRGERRVAQAEILYVFLKIEDKRLQEAREGYLEILTREARFIE